MPLKGRQILFVVGKTAYVVKTNKAGIAQVAPEPPLPHGTPQDRRSFQGDELDMGSGLRVNARIVNSRGHVRSKGALKLSARRNCGSTRPPTAKRRTAA